MKTITDRLLAMLCNRGLTDQEIPWLVRDVLHIINHNPVFTLEHLNRKLSTLGWDEDLLDGHVLELMLYLIEDDMKTASAEGQVLH